MRTVLRIISAQVEIIQESSEGEDRMVKSIDLLYRLHKLKDITWNLTETMCVPRLINISVIFTLFIVR